MGALLPVQGVAVAGLEMALGRIQGAGWSANDVRIQVTVGVDGGNVMQLRAESVGLPPPFASLRDVTVVCRSISAEDGKLDCPSGELSLRSGGQTVSTTFRFERTPEVTRFALTATRVHDALLEIELAAQPTGWRATIGIRSEHLGTTIAGLLATGSPVSVSSGAVWMRALVSGQRGVDAAEVKGEVSRLSFSDESGLRAAESLAVSLDAALERGSEVGWSLAGTIELLAGAANFDSFFIEASSPAQRLELRGQWLPEHARLVIEHFSATHPGVLDLQGSMEATSRAGFTPDSLRLHLPRTSLPVLYRTYLRNAAFELGLGGLDTGGEVALSLDWASQGASVRLDLHDVDARDERGRFEAYALNGSVHWSDRGDVEQSRLRWAGGALYAVSLGAGELSGRWYGRTFSLSDPLSLTVLDGSLDVRSFELEDLGLPTLGWRLHGELAPISMNALSRALGWPAFEGTLAGSIPEVSYLNGVISAPGTLVMRVFDGEVLIRDLELERPFGLVPVLRGDIDIRNLSLLPLTNAFSFGSIEGRLDGYMHDLVLQDWYPVSFDALFATPPDDSERHRISQHAVESLTRLGGARDVVSSTFLRLFQEFSYERLGVRCRLRGGVCEMGGVAPAERGYYIVKGGGFPPRIDVFGFNDRVAWDTLLERLKSVTSAEAPIIQ